MSLNLIKDNDAIFFGAVTKCLYCTVLHRVKYSTVPSEAHRKTTDN